MRFIRFCIFYMMGFALIAGTVSAQAPTADVKGSKDHPLLTRFTNSLIIGYFQKDWEQTTFPLSVALKDEQFIKQVSVEGKITRIVYLAPAGKSRLEVYRNYERALLAAGLQNKFSCESNCGQLFFHWRFGSIRKSMTWGDGYLQSRDGKSNWNLADAPALEEGRCLYGTLKRGGQEIHILIYTSLAGYAPTDSAATVVEIAEPKEMETGQVTVNANALMEGLATDGKVAIYGIYFDTGKSEIKDESKPQLEEMARLLRSHPALKVFIVGHTDNQGTFETNIALSKQRAVAVAEALRKTYGIESRLMIPYGVANVAPVSSNAEESGRAKNRRVELVSQ